MSNHIDSRPPFFPNKNRDKYGISNQGSINPDLKIKSNAPARVEELSKINGNHANVSINDSVKDFAKIKSAVSHAPEVDNSDKIAKLKAQINAGTYNVDYEALADKILEQEF